MVKNILISSSQINQSPDRLLISSLFYLTFLFLLPFSFYHLLYFLFFLLFSTLLFLTLPSPLTSFSFSPILFSLLTFLFLSCLFLLKWTIANALTIKAQTNKDSNKSKRQYKKNTNVSLSTDNFVRLRRVSEAQRHTSSSCIWSRTIIRPTVRHSALLSRYVHACSQTDGHRLWHSKVKN